MVRGVPVAFLSTGRAGTDARLEQGVHYQVVPLASAGKDPRGDVTDVRTCLAERDADAHRADVLLDEIRVRTGDAGLHAAQGSVDRRCDVY